MMSTKLTPQEIVDELLRESTEWASRDKESVSVAAYDGGVAAGLTKAVKLIQGNIIDDNDDCCPVTEQWLASVGAIQSRKGTRDIGDEWILGGRLSFYFWPNGSTSHEFCGGGEFVCWNRGDVRRLAKCLGLTIHESESSKP